MSLDTKKRASYLKLSGKEAFLNQFIAKLGKSPRRLFGAVICGVGIVLLITSIAGGLGGEPPPDTPQPRTAMTETATPAPEDEAAAPNPSGNQPAQQKKQPTPQTPTNTQQTSTTSAQTTTNPQHPPESEPATIAVSLSVNNTYKGEVSLAKGSNHCDVLKKALADGLISSLEMRYSQQYKTYGVYIIDDIGEKNAVWWTYTVNGKSPPIGCSHTKANDGDAVTWEYQK